jgi:NAD(P)-dependent dehydrogenase (short-subunit alcohol dehydrogenase family)
MAPVFLVTGGSRGIGAAVARLAAEQGAAVAVNYVSNAEAAQAVVDDIVSQGGQAISCQGDMAVEADIMRVFDACEAKLGPVAVLVNNAGVLDQEGNLEEFSADRISRIVDLNVTGVLICCREAVRRMSTKNGGAGGSIVNISSMAATLGSGGAYVDYATSKGAIDTLTIGLAREVARQGIRVNGIRPGIIETDIHASGGNPSRAKDLADTVPMGRAGKPEEIAEAVIWLVSDKASYVTGSTINVSGGR